MVKATGYHLPMESHAAPPLHRRLRMRHLALLCALGETGSIHGAASNLGMSQPAASKMLIEAEKVLGVSLFDRTHIGVNPTMAGVALIARARRVLNVLDAARDEVDAIQSASRTLVTVGIYPVAASVLAPRALAWLRTHDTGVRVRIQEGGSESLLQGLRQGSLDCVVGRVSARNDISGFEIKHLYDEGVSVGVRPEHPLAKRRRVTWTAAAEFPWVLPLPNAPLRSILASWFSRHGRAEPYCLLESGSFMANLSVVRDSDALALFPHGLAMHYAQLGLIHVLALELKANLPSIALLHRGGEPLSDATSAFWNALRAVAPGK